MKKYYYSQDPLWPPMPPSKEDYKRAYENAVKENVALRADNEAMSKTLRLLESAFTVCGWRKTN